MKHNMIKLLFLILIFNFLLFSFDKAFSQVTTTTDLAGFAWSENIGWISFNSINCDPDKDGRSNGLPGCPPSGTPIPFYRVALYPNNHLAGYAWSENVGWISFNRQQTGDPPPDYDPCPDRTCIAKLEGSRIVGWARVCSALSEGCIPPPFYNTGGWDGWIKFNGSNYGVSFNSSTGEFSGFAWGGDDASSSAVIGWISFYKVSLMETPNNPPNVTAKSVDASSSWVICGRIEGSRAYFEWKFFDPDQDEYQLAFQIQIATDSNFNSIVVDTQKIVSPSQSFLLDKPFGLLDWNKTYYWRLKIWDSHNLESDWIYGGSFVTPRHSYPKVDFNWVPANPRVGEEVQFYGTSTAYGGATINLWQWTFQDGSTFTFSNRQNPTSTFYSLNPKATLTVTDSHGFSCSKEKTLNQTTPTPFFKEIKPSFYKIKEIISYFLQFLQNLVSGIASNLLSSISFLHFSQIP
jgi:hypothetical protein